MQSSGQQPKENIEREKAEVEDPKDHAASPLYEFPAEQQGMVYPPPPSYYQNMQIPTVRATLPLPPGSHAQFSETGVHVPASVPTRYPEMQAPIKKSYKWVWIVVSIFSVGILITCGLCAWGAYQLFDTVIKQETGATDVVNSYFQDVQHQSYAQAYQSLQISGLTPEGYSRQAEASDAQNGLLLSYVVGQPIFGTNSNTGPDLSHWRYTVDVTRAKNSYPVLIAVEKIGGSWKITYIDRY